MKYKRCACCKRLLPVECFSKNLRNKDGLHSYCRECNARKANEFKKRAGPDYARRYAIEQRKRGYFRFGKGAYLNMKKSAGKRGIDFFLTEEELKKWWKETANNCFYCGCNESEYVDIRNFIESYNGPDELINYIKKHVYNKKIYYKINTMTIDRVDSNGPYSKDNIVKSCWICNSIKSNNIPEQEMKKIGKKNLEMIKRIMKNE